MNKKYYSQARHRQSNYIKFIEYLSSSKCKDCGNSNSIVLEFDHLPEFEKKFNIGRAVTGSTRSWNAILNEIEKCEVVCANCHRIRTATRSNDRKFQVFNGTYNPEEYEEPTRFRVAHGEGKKGRRGCKCNLCVERYRQYHRDLRENKKKI